MSDQSQGLASPSSSELEPVSPSEPAPTPDPETLPPTVAPAERRGIPWARIVAVGASIAAALFFVMWLGARSEADDAKSELANIENAAAELPDLEEMAQDHGLTSRNVHEMSPESLAMTFHYGTEDLEALLQDLGFSGGTMSRIRNTRALDGTLTADAPHATASWTYHPDDGLAIVIERSGR